MLLALLKPLSKATSPGSILLVNKPRNRLKQPSFARREIDLIRQLDDKASSDKLRDNPIESAGRTVHIQQAFHKILDEEITLVLKSNEVNEKLHEAEEAAAKKKAHEQNCTGKMSEAEKIEKTLSTFSPAERILAAQYRKANFETSSKGGTLDLLSGSKALTAYNLDQSCLERCVVDDRSSLAKTGRKLWKLSNHCVESHANTDEGELDYEVICTVKNGTPGLERFSGNKGEFTMWKDKVLTHVSQLDLEYQRSLLEKDQPDAKALPNTFLSTLPDAVSKMDPCEIWKALEKTYGLGDAGGLIELTRQWTKLAGTIFRDLVTHLAMLKKLRNDINRKSQALRKRKTGSEDSTSCFYCFGSGQYKKDCPVLKSDGDPNRAGGPLFRTDVNTAPGAKKVQIGKVTRLMNESDIEMSPSSELDALEITAPGTP
ncbi:hypothetical protein P43SY_000068 [Pythium insidiosum]|uniref:Uncharacterized protein n=1 Tax=Pythium insidiosum TaxID=114742 RepID=A0AAD5LAP6_PYTIN|nr:hypothetical protein P43SY_000068 [Pythium insidiosum]